MTNSKKSPSGAVFKHGGKRTGAGRKGKTATDRQEWGQITCTLRNETIQKLKEGAAKRPGEESRFFGKFLQYHLDRHPLPTWDEYQAIRQQRPLIRKIGRRRVPVIISAGSKDPIKSVDRRNLPVPEELRRRPLSEKETQKLVHQAIVKTVEEREKKLYGRLLSRKERAERIRNHPFRGYDLS
jgi:hypothetical protein